MLETLIQGNPQYIYICTIVHTFLAVVFPGAEQNSCQLQAERHILVSTSKLEFSFQHFNETKTTILMKTYLGSQLVSILTPP